MTLSQPVTRIVACAVVLLSLVCARATEAGAATLEAGCGNLQTRIDEAAPSGGADTVVLNGLCKAGATLPKGASFTLQGAPGTNSGFNGEGTTGPLLSTPELAGAMTIEDMTFEHAKRTSSASGGALDLEVRQLTLRNDDFVDDTDEFSSDASGGGVRVTTEPSSGSSCKAGEPPALTVTGSTFLEDRAVTTGTAYSTQGGGLFAAIGCAGRTSVFEDDVFERDRSEAKGSVEPEGLTTGGGLTLLSFSVEPGNTVPVQQRGNVFDSNTVSGPAERNDGGGGEWLAGMSLTSVGDRFSRNSVSGTTGSAWSWGGGLGILGTECNQNSTENTLEDAVVAANSIGAGTASDLGGAGIYVGCEGINKKSSNYLSLLDSTVTANSVATAGGVSGIDGHQQDQLAIANSIVVGNAGGAQLGGFTGAGGALSSQFSDVCDEAGTAPLGGEGNICADPKLADDGNSSSYDVHESPASPTIDAGSNSLLPSGLNTDFFGDPRSLPGHVVLPACTPGAAIGYKPGPSVVDMGADEYGPLAVPAIALLCPGGSKPSSTFAFPTVHQAHSGEIGLAFKGLPTGKLSVKGTFRRTKIVAERIKGRIRHVHRAVTVLYGSASYTGSAAASPTIKLKPNRVALAYLKAHKRVSIQLTLTFTATGAVPSTQHRTILVRYLKPAKKRR